MSGGASRAKRTAAAAAVLLLLVSALAIFPPGAASPSFAADGNFGEWESVPGVPDRDGGDGLPGSVDLQEVKVAAPGRGLFVYGKTREALFAQPREAVLRVFVDADADERTGFDAGGLGADLLLEAAGAGGALVASGIFSFSPGRDRDDWNGWQLVGRAPAAVSGDRFEVAIPGVVKPESARVRMAVSDENGAQDLQDFAATAGGELLVRQDSPEPAVLSEGEHSARVLDVAFEAWGRPRAVSALSLSPAGTGDFTAVASARLEVAVGKEVAGTLAGKSEIHFLLDPPLELAPGQVARAAISLDIVEGGNFSQGIGKSFGATIARVQEADTPGFVVLQPKRVPPAFYLGFVSSEPVVDGAFGEWKLAQAAPDPNDVLDSAGLDLVGTRAMATATSAAFFAETRGDILPGASQGQLARRVAIPQPGPPGGPGGPTMPPEPAVEPPPLSADDRLLVFVDADLDPRTGYRLSPDLPVGADYVIQIAGRFSEVREAQLLEFAGTAPGGTAWIPRGTVRAAVAGSALEGEIPITVLEGGGGARLLFQTVTFTGRTADLSDALQELPAPSSSPDDYLHFRIVTFDPLLGPPPVREALLTDTPNGYWVVQLREPPTTAKMAALEAAGATLFGYVHSNAYLAKMDGEAAELVRSMPEIRYLGIYQPAFKFASDPAGWGEGTLDLLALLFARSQTLERDVAKAGGTVLSSTDSSLRVRIAGDRAQALGWIPEIQFIEPENRRVPLNDVSRRIGGVNLTFDRTGLNGSRIIVGISDTGLDFTHPAFDDTGDSTSGPRFDGRIVAYYRYGGSYGDSDGHGTHTAGSIAGDGDLSSTVNNSVPGGTYQFRGVAPGASLVVTEIIGSSPPADDQVFADQQAYGATASSNSWGYVDNSNNPITLYDTSAYLTDKSAIDANTSRAGLQPVVIVFAAGNAGPTAGSVGSPGTAKNVITVGASESDRGYDSYADNSSSVASFSSRGPTDDGRIKPDIVAVGTYVLSTQSRTGGCSCTYGGWDKTWTGANYAFSSGTSQATPLISGMVALVQQHINDTYGGVPSPALVKAALINGGEDLGYGFEHTTGATGPMIQGWGRANVTRSIVGPDNGTILFYDEGPTVGSGDVVVRRFTVANDSTPLKVTLVWTDAPGNPVDTTTLPELVNDLDLVVRAPNGTYYHGNKFNLSWSRANNTTFDRLNNVENVFAKSPATGTWTVEVSGYSIKSADQRFALAVSGNLSEKGPPGVGDPHSVPGAPPGGKLGWNMTASGSVNGDGYSDVVIGAPGASGGNGSVYIFFGGPSANFQSLNVSKANVTLNGSGAEGFGWSVDESADFDGDGINDLLIGAPNGGKAYLFRGSSNWTSRTANVTFNGSSADLFGAAVRLVGALDNRSGAEVAVGAPLANSSAGAVYIFSGGSASGIWNASGANATLSGNASGWRLGTSLAGGDLNGDGKGDLAAGAPGASVVRVALGGPGPSALAFNATFTGLPGTAFGQSVSLDGDINGDGRVDLLIGAPLANASAGAAYVFFGRATVVDDQVIRTYFFDDMESGTGKWDEMSGSSISASPWSLSSTVYHGDEASGHSWQDSSGNYVNNEDASIAFKDPINLSGASSPVLTFVYRADLEGIATNYDGFNILYTTNNGTSWTQLDANNSQGNYDTTAYRAPKPADRTPIADEWAFTYDRFVWRKVTFNVSSLAGNSSVKFRFQFASDTSVVADGIYLDDVAVRDARPTSPNFTAYGESAGDRLGWSVASIGDANGDGYAEVALGAPSASNGLTAGAGAAYVFAGSSTLNGSSTANAADEQMRGSERGANLGWAVTGFAGFNNSSATFLLAGSPGAGGGNGGVRFGDATASIPEFGEIALPIAGVVLAFAVMRRKRRNERDGQPDGADPELN